jgi:hypothetical protein
MNRVANLFPKAWLDYGSMALVIGALFFSGYARAVSIVVPNSSADTETGDNNSFPFSIGYAGFNSQRYQQVYDASQFAAARGGGYVTQILFRPDGDGVHGFAFTNTLASVQIQLSTTSAGVSNLSTTFVNNVGTDVINAYSGALPLSSACTGPAGGPKNFDIVINLQTPFFYNSANGNLLMDVRNYNGGFTTFFDSVDNLSDSVSRLYTLASDGVNLATGQGDTSGLVTEFTIVPPSLNINVSGKNVALSWTTNALAWLLQSAVNLDGPWSDFSASMSVQGTNVVVTAPPTNSCQFFRLRYP